MFGVTIKRGGSSIIIFDARGSGGQSGHVGGIHGGGCVHGRIIVAGGGLYACAVGIKTKKKNKERSVFLIIGFYRILACLECAVRSVSYRQGYDQVYLHDRLGRCT